MISLKNYFLIGFRTLLNNKFYSLLTAVGLAMGMAASIVLFIYADYEWHFDTQFPEFRNIYRVYNESSNEGTTVKDANSHSAVGPELKASLPAVVDYTRIYTMANHTIAMRVNENVFPLKKAYVVDEGFLRMFPFTPAHPLHDPLKKPYSVVLTRSLSNKLFGNAESIGQTISLAGHGMDGEYFITGILEDLPGNTHFNFEMLISYATKYAKGHEDNWENYWDYNYIQLKAGTSPNDVERELIALSEKHLKASALVLRLQPLKGLHLDSNLTYELSDNGERDIIKGLLIIAFAILIVAWINYINLTTARSIARAREVGIRKVLGAGRRQLIVHFLSESVIQNMAAMLIALAFVQVAMPLANEVFNRELTFRLFGSLSFWQMLLILYAASVIISGFYPALALSSLNPALSLKGNIQSGKQSIFLRRTLVIVQFTVSAVLIAGTFLIYLQTKHMTSQPMGINLSQTMILRAPIATERDSSLESRIHAFSNELSSLAGVAGISSSSIVPGQNISTIAGSNSGFWRQGDPSEQKRQYYYINVDENFFPQYEINFLAGHNFIPGNTQWREEVIINRAALESLGFNDPNEAVNQNIVYGSNRQHKLRIAAVVDNFSIQSLKERPAPTLYYYRSVTGNQLLSIKLSSADSRSIVAQTDALWKKNFRDQPFEYNFLDQEFNKQYDTEERVGLLFGSFSLLGILIACFGLFGLVSFSTLKRIKEIGIRKVLGASAGHIVTLFSGEFIKLVLVACLIAMPLIWFGAESWLNNYAYRIRLSWWLFLFPFTLLFIITILTVLSAALKPARENPIDAIKAN